MRDSQRSKVYEAESLVRLLFDRANERDLRTVTMHGSTLTLPIERQFASIESIQNYLDAVLALDWVQQKWPDARRRVHVRERTGAGGAHYEPGSSTIAVPLHRNNSAWALREFVVLHELAHHLEPDESDFASHGGEFVERFVTLVDQIIGAEAAFVLRASMLDAGVTFR